MPSSAKDRFTVDFENVFFFTKSQRYYFETQYEPIIPDSHGQVFGGKNRHEGYVNPTYSGKEWNPSSLGRIKRCVWRISTKPFSGAHFAVFPEQLVETPIKATCPPDGIVLDPFMGAGTTGLVALKLARQFVGIELNPAYIKLAEERLRPFIQQLKLQ